MSVYGVTCVLKMLVLPIKHIEVLVGLDWFEKTRASIEPLTKTLKFASKTVCLESGDINDNKLIDDYDLLNVCAIEDVEDIFNEAEEMIWTDVEEVRFETIKQLNEEENKMFLENMSKLK